MALINQERPTDGPHAPNGRRPDAANTKMRAIVVTVKVIIVSCLKAGKASALLALNLN